MDKPWLKYDMTEDEWRQYEDEYADYIDGLIPTGNTLKDKIAIQNAIERAEHARRRQEALNKIRKMREQMKKENLDGVSAG